MAQVATLRECTSMVVVSTAIRFRYLFIYLCTTHKWEKLAKTVHLAKCKHDHFWYYWRNKFHSAWPIQNVIMFWPFYPFDPPRLFKIWTFTAPIVLAERIRQRQYIGADIFISWIGVADRICRMTIRLTWHRLFKKLISSANTIGAVIKARIILTPLPLFVQTMPIQKALTSGNGNIDFYRENNPRSPQWQTEPELLCSSPPRSFFVTIYL